MLGLIGGSLKIQVSHVREAARLLKMSIVKVVKGVCSYTLLLLLTHLPFLTRGGLTAWFG
jgi:hypothetical protein